jgi:hypothetical protein
MTVAPLHLQDVLPDPGRVRELVEGHGPFWNQARYQPAEARSAAAVTPTGHPFAMEGGAPPLYRGDWADVDMVVEGAEALVTSPVLADASCRLFGGVHPRPTFLYVNVTAPMPRVDAGHTDVPAFRGLDRRRAPGWLLLAMARSGLFDQWLVRTATAVIWFYDGQGGALSYWPAGPDGPSEECAPETNSAIVGDSDRMFHRVEAIGDPDLWRSVPRTSLLHHAGRDRWEIRDGSEVLACYRFEQLRISLSWKADVVLDEAERQRRDHHLDDLTLDDAVGRLAGELGWTDAGLDDPAFVEAIVATYPRQAPPG